MSFLRHSVVSKPKTEVQCVNKEKQQIMMEDEQLKQMENFVYLGGTVSADQSCDKDTERKIGLAAGIATPVSVRGVQHSRPSHVVAVAGPCRLRDRDSH